MTWTPSDFKVNIILAALIQGGEVSLTRWGVQAQSKQRRVS